MKELLQPAIRYAREGFPVTEVIAEGWAANARLLKQYPNYAETFMPDGRAPRKGEVFRNPLLANTLAAISAGGRDAFYQGEIAQRIEKYMKANGGYLTAADLAAHRAEWVEPVSTNYRGYDVWELPPNTQGVAALQMLNILEPYDLKSMGFGSPEYPFVRRGEEAGVRRPGAFLRRSAVRQDSAPDPAVEGVRGQAARIDPERQGGAAIPRGRQGARAR
jgi:gamma-glutamyltranspeptidase / glutathione hydrolase